MPDVQGGGDDPAGAADVPADPHAHRVSHYENAAREAVVAHPLPGENLDTPYLEDAQMWLRVYTELLEFKQTLIDDTEQALTSISAPGREEIGKTDAVILAAEAQRFRQRLSLWERRCDELAQRS